MNSPRPFLKRIIIPASLLIAAGCAHRQPAPPPVDPLLGNWSGDIDGPNGEKGLSMTLSVHPDGAMIQTQTLEGKTLTLYSRYTTSKDILTETLQRAEAGGQTVAGTGQTKSFEYVVQGDTLALTTKESRGVLLFKRVKP